MVDKLIYGKLEKGNYYVRPIEWEGIWSDIGKLCEGNILYEFETEKECILAIKANEISVFRMNDYEWWASKLSLEETEKIYEKETGEINELDEIYECDIDYSGMWCEIDGEEKFPLKYGLKYNSKNNIKFGDVEERNGGKFIYIPFRIAIMNVSNINNPICIASTEY